uniref:hypothetical protein n=2 Tax=unclassified Sphingomonas TaxID=196159 RepID=UPI000A5A8BA5
MMPDDAIAAFRPRDPGFVADPYPVYAVLRDHAPLCFHPGLNYRLVARYRDVAALLRDPLIGHAEQGTVGQSGDATEPPSGPLTPARLIEAGRASAETWLSKLNPPRHG